MKLAGFPLNSRWSSADYLAFLRQNGWSVRKSTVLKASFPLTYAECVKPAVKGNPGNGERSYRRLHGETELPQASKLISGETAETRFFKAQQLVNFNKNLAYM